MKKLFVILSFLISLICLSSQSWALQELRVQKVDCDDGTFSDSLNIETNEKTFVANLCSSDLIIESPKDKNAINYFIESCPVNFSEIENGTIIIEEEGLKTFFKA